MSKIINTVIISDDPESTLLLKSVFESTEYKIIFESAHLDKHISGTWLIDPDLLIVVKSYPDPALLRQLSTIFNQYPLPIVVFTKVVMDDAIEQAIEAGISSYIIDGLNEYRVIPILKTAIIRFLHHNKLLKQLDELKTNLADRKIIDRAKGLVMHQRQCSEDEAYKLLRSSAMKQNMRLATLSKTIVEATA